MNSLYFLLLLSILTTQIIAQEATLLKDHNGTEFSSFDNDFINGVSPIDHNLYYLSTDNHSSIATNSLYRSDGTPDGTVKLATNEKFVYGERIMFSDDHVFLMILDDETIDNVFYAYSENGIEEVYRFDNNFIVNALAYKDGLIVFKLIASNEIEILLVNDNGNGFETTLLTTIANEFFLPEDFEIVGDYLFFTRPNFAPHGEALLTDLTEEGTIYLDDFIENLGYEVRFIYTPYAARDYIFYYHEDEGGDYQGYALNVVTEERYEIPINTEILDIKALSDRILIHTSDNNVVSFNPTDNTSEFNFEVASFLISNTTNSLAYFTDEGSDFETQCYATDGIQVWPVVGVGSEHFATIHATDKDLFYYGVNSGALQHIDLVSSESTVYSANSKSLYLNSEIVNSRFVFLSDLGEVGYELFGLDVSLDVDGDGFTHETDCDDYNDSISPDGIEIEGNEIDENCDGSLISSINLLRQEEIKVFPNPATDILFYSDPNNYTNTITIIDAFGRVVRNLEKNETIYIDSLPIGLYTLMSYDYDNNLIHRKTFIVI